MKAPLSWLKEYVDIDCSAENLKDKLFSCGFEVEEMIYVAGNIDKVVTCKIIEIEKHPNANKLSVTKVDAGKYGILQIITAATNIFVGAIVPVALDGSTLVNGQKIFTGELRGLPSYGMFCSGEELGITDDWYKGASVHGILILEDNLPLGEDIKKILQLEDVMFDINITANRPDCQSILGLAREVAAVLKKPLKMPDLTYRVDQNVSTKTTIKVEDNAFDLCPRYISHLVKDIKLTESPVWLKRRLFSMGIRSINNIVDITNYVLLEIGQPMHAFDLNDISGKSIIIRRAFDAEKIITLDNKEFALNNSNLVICDTSKPVALAGIMGGLNSEIKPSTTSIVFESAKFARDNIRKSSKALGQRTEASSRYEKGVDAYSAEIGMKRALNLISTLNCGKIACDEYDLYSGTIEQKIIQTSVEKIQSVLGIKVPDDEIVSILQNLNFGVNLDNGNLTVKIPLYREDMESYQDIAEEIIREYGYDKLVPSLLQTSSITNGGRNEQQIKIEKLKDLLVGFGFNEIITYSFVSEKEYELFGLDKDSENHRFIKILNPLGEDLSVMRTSLLPSAVRTACYNLKRKNFNGRLFELAKVYVPQELPLVNLPIEKMNLSIITFGENEDFFTIKGYVEGVIEAFCNGSKIEFKPCSLTLMHPTRSTEIFVNGVNIGCLGQLSPVICDKLDVDKPIFVAELYYDLIIGKFKDKIIYNTISKFPIVERDLALIIDEEIPYSQVLDCIKSSGGEFLTKVSLFDVYQGDQIQKGKKSMAFNLIYLANDRTLNVDEVEDSIQNILKSLREELNVQLR